MNRVWSSTLMVVSLVLMLAGAPSWGQVPRSNDTSDFAGNTGGGGGALFSNTPSTSTNDGHFNTAYGNGTLFRNTIGQENAAFGLNALNANTTGDFNTASGVGALQQNRSGNNNTAVGYRALFNNTTATGNIAVGVDAGFNLTSGGNNIYLGSRGVATESNTLRIGAFYDPNTQQGQVTAYIPSILESPVVSGGNPVYIDGSSGQVGFLPSSTRYKEDIHSLEQQSESIYRLRPVTFTYKQDPDRNTHFGLIAEEMNDVYPNLVIRNAKGNIETVQYQELTPLILHQVQRQREELDALRAETQRLREMVGRLRAEVPSVQPAVTTASKEE